MIILYILGALLAFSILVIGHEFGHFTAAKLNGVKVEEFSLGMGPKLFSIKGKETEYLIKALPIGGYVKMHGEEGEECSDNRAFSSKSPLQKLSIVAAGPIMNLIMAIIFFAITARTMGYIIPKIDKVQDNSPAMHIGIKKGDEVIKFNNEKISSWTDFQLKMSKVKGEKINIGVKRGEEELNFYILPKESEGRYMIGVVPTVVKPNLGQMLKSGVDQTVDITKQTFSFFKSLFTGNFNKNDVGGPITIIKVSVKVASKGVVQLVYFMALLSVQLAIFNLIPFPALDGGWIFILLIQVITGKKISEDRIAQINYIGFIILISLMILVTIKDIINPIQF